MLDMAQMLQRFVMHCVREEVAKTELSDQTDTKFQFYTRKSWCQIVTLLLNGIVILHRLWSIVAEREIMLFLVSPRSKVTEAASEVADTCPFGPIQMILLIFFYNLIMSEGFWHFRIWNCQVLLVWFVCIFSSSDVYLINWAYIPALRLLPCSFIFCTLMYPIRKPHI